MNTWVAIRYSNILVGTFRHYSHLLSFDAGSSANLGPLSFTATYPLRAVFRPRYRYRKCTRQRGPRRRRAVLLHLVGTTKSATITHIDINHRGSVFLSKSDLRVFNADASIMATWPPVFHLVSIILPGYITSSTVVVHLTPAVVVISLSCTNWLPPSEEWIGYHHPFYRYDPGSTFYSWCPRWLIRSTDSSDSGYQSGPWHRWDSFYL